MSDGPEVALNWPFPFPILPHSRSLTGGRDAGADAVYVQLKADATNVVSKRLSVPLTAGPAQQYEFTTVRIPLAQFGGGKWNQVSLRGIRANPRDANRVRLREC